MSGVAQKIKLKQLVNRFLAWPLPSSVCSDQCVTIHQYPHSRSGTNLLNADEAYQMIEHVIGGDLEDKRSLQCQLDELKQSLETQTYNMNVMNREWDMMVKALEFYGDRKNWDERWIEEGDQDSGGDISDVISREDVDLEDDNNGCYFTYGGKIARETLRKVSIK